MRAPTLIVGLGGTGAKIAAKVIGLATEQQRKDISVVIFDTDVNELNGIKDKYPFVKRVQTSTKMTVGEFLDVDVHAREEWFPLNPVANRKALTEGAGQVRAISRLALDTAIRAGKLKELHEAIDDLFKLEFGKPDQVPRVTIVSSLAGGTGSGILLPVANYLRNYFQNRFHQQPIIRGFFILPEIFYSVIPSESEKNNLKCNAYATLRELDAFLMRADGTLPERYKGKIHLDIPRTTGDKSSYEDINVLPYDFCFLFDSQNVDGEKLNSKEEYENHAAACIYAQSIGPMNKRVNSSEDNVIRKLAREKGRNRYAGAGSSILRYPYDDIVAFIAKNWVNDSVSKTWLKYDVSFKELTKQDSDKRAKGMHVPDRNEEQEYVTSVDNGVSDKDPMSMIIKNSCTIFDADQYTEIGKKWEYYLSALFSHIEAEAPKLQGGIDDLRKNTESAIGALSETNSTADYISAYKKLDQYYARAKHEIDRVASSIGFTLFNVNPDESFANMPDHKLERYLVNQKHDFVHPNAARYFIYNVIAAIESELVAIVNDKEKNQKYFDDFEKINFRDPKDEDAPYHVNNLGKRKVGKLATLKKKPDKWQRDLTDNYNNYLSRMKKWRVDAIKVAVLEEGLKYCKKLAKSFKIFFDSLEDRLDKLKREIAADVTKYEDLKGQTIRYVAASETAFKHFADKYSYTGKTLDIDPGLSQDIYREVLRYSKLDEATKPENFYEKVFRENIIGYYESSVKESYGSSLNLTVIEALEKEYEIEKGKASVTQVQHYVRDQITETKRLSNPFIERPLGEEKQVNKSCTFNSALLPKDDPTMQAFINEQLIDYGGEIADIIPQQDIVFYNSIYDLRASDLTKFAPESASDVYQRQAGEYNKAYFDLVNRIKPLQSEAREITPHIDKNWHLISYLPDLDEESQRQQEGRIYDAMIYAILFKKVNYDLVSSGQARYTYNITTIDNKSEELIVSNGTPCDKFYEVYDALSINPVIVQEIVDSVLQELAERSTDTRQHDFEHALIYEKLKSLQITEIYHYAPELQEVSELSIYSIPLLLNYSYSNEDESVKLEEDAALELFKRLLVIFNEQVESLYSDEQIAGTKYLEFVCEQTKVFINNSPYYKGLFDANKTVVRSLIRAVAESIKQYHYYRESDALGEVAAAVGNQATMRQAIKKFTDLVDIDKA